MTYWLSEPIETLISKPRTEISPCVLKTGTLIVGSGYGAAMAALVLAGQAKKAKDKEEIWIFEKGKEYVPGDFPRSIGDLPGHMGVESPLLNIGSEGSLWDIRLGQRLGAVVGQGLGGTSLINANVLLEPSAETLGTWPTPVFDPTFSWSYELRESIHFVKTLLDATPHPNARCLPKYRALERLATSLKGEVKPAEIAVSFQDGPNQVEVEQTACNDCGNCVTGCNIGAKNTLAMNAWPLAKRLGVKIFTGATVLRLEYDAMREKPWRVYFGVTPSDKATHSDESKLCEPCVQASRVILAAGTFGSTQILHASKGLRLSKRLGQGFSPNGDFIAFGYGQKNTVKAVAKHPSDKGVSPKAEKTGPTIVGTAKVPLNKRNSETFTLQDGVVPFALARVFGELTTTQGAIHHYAGETNAWLKHNPKHDALAVSQDMMDHTQVMLTMGRDDINASLIPTSGKKHATLVPAWGGEAGSFYPTLDETLATQDAGEGLDEGRYLPEPTWRFLPKSIQNVFGPVYPKVPGGEVPKYLITVHPLGGCAMGQNANEGVVNPLGQVFSLHNAQTDTLYPGLFVLDGAVMPGAVGVNPLVSIGAFSHYAACRIAGAKITLDEILQLAPPLEETPKDDDDKFNPRKVPPANGSHQLENYWSKKVEATFHERLVMCCPEEIDTQRSCMEILEALCPAGTVSKPHSLIMDCDISLPDVFAALENPKEELDAEFKLGISERKRPDGVPDESIHWLVGDDSPLLGKVRLGVEDKPGLFQRLGRWFYALKLLQRLRPRNQLLRGSPGEGAFPRSWCQVFFHWVNILRAFFKFGRLMHRRTIEYKCTAALPKLTLSFRGEKTLAFSEHEKPLRDALTVLPFDLKVSRTNAPPLSINGEFEIDMLQFSRGPAPLQINKVANAPTAVLAGIGYGLYFLRAALQTQGIGLWPLDYHAFGSREEESQPRLQPPPTHIGYITPDKSRKKAPRQEYFNPSGKARLTRYCPTNDDGNACRAPLLLIHGLSLGSRIYWTDTLETNLVQAALAEGYDVWLVDFSTSVNLHYDPRQVTMDEVSKGDIPWALETVYEKTRQSVHVFTHCVGSGIFAMALLQGRLCRDHVASIVHHAVPPWVVANKRNRVQANFFSLFKDAQFAKRLPTLDLIPHAESGWLAWGLDTLASLFRFWDGEEWKHHQDHRGVNDTEDTRLRAEHARALCERQTFIYGKEYHHDNLSSATHRQSATFFGPAPFELIRQLYFCVKNNRLTNANGENIYVKEAQVCKHYGNIPTLFLHGKDNKVFDPKSAELSAFMLTRIRRHCDEKNVALAIIPSYGHMDMLIGKNAAEDVYPTVMTFLKAVRTGQMSSCFGKNKICDGDKVCDKEVLHLLPQPMTVAGPIISRVDSEKRKIRVWCETDDLMTWHPKGLVFKSNGRELCTTPIISRDHRWLVDVCLQGVNAPVSLEVRYPKGAVLNPFTLKQDFPWHQLFDNTSSPSGDTVSMLLGSCLHPGTTFERHRSDRIFKGVLQHVCQVGADCLMLLGDTIYADATAGVFDPASNKERYQQRYRNVFGGTLHHQGKEAHKLLSRLPTYFAIDDHEIEDNWQGMPPDPSARQKEQIKAALCKAEHYLLHNHQSSPNDNSLSYSFMCRGLDIFVFDTRTERRRKTLCTDTNLLMSDAQLKKFNTWLGQSLDNSSSRPPVFVATGSPLGPISRDIVQFPALTQSIDSLLGYPEFLNELLCYLKNHEVKRLVMLNGDRHFSAVMQGVIKNDSYEVNFVSICASGLYAPYPFANSNRQAYDWGTCIKLELPTSLHIQCEQRLLCDVPQHFLRAEFISQPKTLKIVMQAFDYEANNIGGYCTTLSENG